MQPNVWEILKFQFLRLYTTNAGLGGDVPGPAIVMYLENNRPGSTLVARQITSGPIHPFITP